jgi:hypothetical protein
MRAVREHEFEHRTSGGIVQFDTYTAARQHEGKETRAQLLSVLGCFTLMAGGVVVVVGLALMASTANR